MATEQQERRYHLAMARMCERRGFYDVALSHIVQARDCPRGCHCEGCEASREEMSGRRRSHLRLVEARP